MKLCPGMWLVSKSHLNISLGFFLLHILSNPPQPRLSVLVQVGKSQPGEQSNSLTEIFHQSSKLLSTTNSFRRKKLLFLYGDISPYTVHPYLTLTDNHPIATAFYMITHLTPRSTSFQPPTHKGPNENSLLCNTPRVGSGL